MRGDYLNGAIYLDLTFKRLSRNFAKTMTNPESLAGRQAGRARVGADPFTAPLRDQNDPDQQSTAKSRPPMKTAENKTTKEVGSEAVRQGVGDEFGYTDRGTAIDITRKVKLQLLAFATVGTVALLIIGHQLSGDSRDAGHRKYTVTLNLAASGGLEFERHLSGRHRRAGSTRSDSPRTASRPPLIIDDSARIPKNRHLRCAVPPAIGEQWRGFRPAAG